MSMGKRPPRGWDEQDVFTGWRKLLCWTSKPGAARYVKRKARRRERHVAKAVLRG